MTARKKNSQKRSDYYDHRIERIKNGSNNPKAAYSVCLYLMLVGAFIAYVVTKTWVFPAVIIVLDGIPATLAILEKNAICKQIWTKFLMLSVNFVNFLVGMVLIIRATKTVYMYMVGACLLPLVLVSAYLFVRRNIWKGKYGHRPDKKQVYSAKDIVIMLMLGSLVSAALVWIIDKIAGQDVLLILGEVVLVWLLSLMLVFMLIYFQLLIAAKGRS